MCTAWIMSGLRIATLIFHPNNVPILFEITPGYVSSFRLCSCWKIVYDITGGSPYKESRDSEVIA